MMMIEFEIVPRIGRCKCCARETRDGQVYCYYCLRARFKAYDDCIDAGLSVENAMAVVNEMYPKRFKSFKGIS
jgi:hypothetical protein